MAPLVEGAMVGQYVDLAPRRHDAPVVQGMGRVMACSISASVVLSASAVVSAAAFRLSAGLTGAAVALLAQAPSLGSRSCSCSCSCFCSCSRRQRQAGKKVALAGKPDVQVAPSVAPFPGNRQRQAARRDLAAAKYDIVALHARVIRRSRRGHAQLGTVRQKQAFPLIAPA